MNNLKNAFDMLLNRANGCIESQRNYFEYNKKSYGALSL